VEFNINTNPDLDDIKVGSLVYYKEHHACIDHTIGIVIAKLDFDLPSQWTKMYEILLEDERMPWCCLRELILVETGEKRT